MIGTINLDYRSLVHHLENAVWMYHCDCIQGMKEDFEHTCGLSMKVDQIMLKSNLLIRFVRSLVKAISPKYSTVGIERKARTRKLLSDEKMLYRP